MFLSEDHIEIERLQKLRKIFWMQKSGGYPVKMEKVIRKVVLAEFNKEKEQIDSEFDLFLKEYSR